MTKKGNTKTGKYAWKIAKSVWFSQSIEIDETERLHGGRFNYDTR
jgi:hypothetical protein